MHTQTTLLALLEEWGITCPVVFHEPMRTVADAAPLEAELPGVICKCLLLKSGAPHWYLGVLPAHDRADLPGLATALGSGGLHFASAEELHDLLGLTPGAVSVLGVCNDPQGRVQVVLDEAVARSAQPLLFHPLVNTASVALSRDDLLRFLSRTGHSPRIVSFSRTISGKRNHP